MDRWEQYQRPGAARLAVERRVYASKGTFGREGGGAEAEEVEMVSGGIRDIRVIEMHEEDRFS